MPNNMMITPLIICQVLVGILTSSVEAFSKTLNNITEAPRPPIMNAGLRERVPSELLASRIGSSAITHGANTERMPATNDISSSAITARYPGR